MSVHCEVGGAVPEPPASGSPFEIPYERVQGQFPGWELEGRRPSKLPDMRYHDLVGADGWQRLPVQVQCRFSKRLPPGRARIYSGEVVSTELSRTGQLVAFLARLVGAPLPLEDKATGPSVVAVTEDAAFDGQIWTRSYARPGRFPQVVQSAKRFRGPTGLEEQVGGGISMSLVATEEAGALVFRSDRFIWRWGRIAIAVPRVLSPGVMTIVHRQEAGNRFSFRLTLHHPLLGTLLHQLAYFEEV